MQSKKYVEINRFTIGIYTFKLIIKYINKQQHENSNLVVDWMKQINFCTKQCLSLANRFVQQKWYLSLTHVQSFNWKNYYYKIHKCEVKSMLETNRFLRYLHLAYTYKLVIKHINKQYENSNMDVCWNKSIFAQNNVYST